MLTVLQVRDQFDRFLSLVEVGVGGDDGAVQLDLVVALDQPVDEASVLV